MYVRTSLAAAALVAIPLAPVVLAAPAQAAWTCTDDKCHAIAHRSPDDGYDDPIPVLCGTNLTRYNIGEGQSSQALGCNDVNRIGAKPGHATNCIFDGTWTTIVKQDPTYTSIKWTSGYLGTPGSGETYICVDVKYDPLGPGGGSGGGGTW